MGFRDLRTKFEENSSNISELDVFRKLYLASLFEIAGNLDTLALMARAQLELADQTKRQQGEFFQWVKDLGDEINWDKMSCNAPKNARTTKAK